MRFTLSIAVVAVAAVAMASGYTAGMGNIDMIDENVRAVRTEEVNDETKTEMKRSTLLKVSVSPVRPPTYYTKLFRRVEAVVNRLIAKDDALKIQLRRQNIDKVFGTTAKLCQHQALLVHNPNSFDNKVERVSQKIIWIAAFLKKRKIHLPPSAKGFVRYTSACRNLYRSVTCSGISGTFRTIDGNCNNLHRSTWGKAGTAQLRFFPSAYDDGIESPRQTSYCGFRLPSARHVSNALQKSRGNPNSVDDNKFSVALTAWGQFLDHDLTLTPVSVGKDGANIQCCGKNLKNRPQCFPINIPCDDERFKPGGCMEFVRSLPAVEDQCNPSGVREILNKITAFIDASNVYGSDDQHANDLRNPSDKAKMKMKQGHLPEAPAKDCNSKVASEFCKLAGDERVNEAPHLTMLHTCFAKHHNKVVDVLRGLNTHWDQNRLYEESRKIIGAIAQHITQNEFLPIVLDSKIRTKYGLNVGTTRYNRKANPSIRNEFSTAAYRFGHSLIQTNQAASGANFAIFRDFKLDKTFFNPHLVHTHVNGNARWTSTAPCKRGDSQLVKEVTNHLFQDELGDAFDLMALNIQRGRDHGLPDYVTVRKLLGLLIPYSFRDLWTFSIMSKKDAYRMVYAYSNINDIDLFAGGISEKPFGNGILGQTFSEIVGKQFQLLKEGDRFWYEHRSGSQIFKDLQLNAIKKATLSLVMCDCFDLTKLPLDVFRKWNGSSTIPHCGKWATAQNLHPWKE